MLALMGIRDWPIDERPREKLLERGAAALSDAEILAILLGSGRKGRSALDVARDVLQASDRCASSSARIARDSAPGGPRARALRAGAGGRRAVAASAVGIAARGPLLASPKATRDFLSARLRDLEHEVFCCLYLDKRHRLIQFEELFRGTIDGASVHPREIVKLALQKNAAAVIVAHNHPLCCIAVSPPGFGVTAGKVSCGPSAGLAR
jgi:DNA repair protein RadC